MYRNRSQFRFLSSLLALVVLLSQSAFAFASLDMLLLDSEQGMTACHSKMMSEQATANKTKASKSCKQDCCDSNDCTSHCLSCVSLTTGGLIPVVDQINVSHQPQSISLKTSQIPSGIDPSSLYRPPRNLI